MTRPFGAMMALCCLASTSFASIDRKLPPTSDDLRSVLAARLRPGVRELPPPPKIELTDATEVYLDGKPCKLKDVP